MNKHDQLYPTSTYHVYNRAHGDELMFREPWNYSYFIKLYLQRIEPYVKTLAYCLLPNHFHLLIQVRESEVIYEKARQDIDDIPKFLSLQFRHFFVAYTKGYNRHYARKGGLFMNRFKRKLVSNEPYLITVWAYVHFNPIKHGLVDSLHDYPHSSYLSYEYFKRNWVDQDIMNERFGHEFLMDLLTT